MKILVVDDSEGMLCVIGDILIKYGHEVETAQTADQALYILNRKKFDLALIDTWLKGVSGLTLVRVIQKSQKNRPVCVLMSVDRQSNDRMQDCGADYFFEKDIPLDEKLIAFLDQFLVA